MILLLYFQSPQSLRPVLEEIARRQIQEYMDSGFYLRGQLEHVSPAFVVAKPKKADDHAVDNLKRYFERNFILSADKVGMN
jgi:hypothetical protein